jgi:hypothetical protein
VTSRSRGPRLRMLPSVIGPADGLPSVSLSMRENTAASAAFRGGLRDQLPGVRPELDGRGL